MRLTRFAAIGLLFTTLSLVPAASTAQTQRRTGETTAPAAAPQPVTASTQTAEETRRDLEELLRQYPPSLPRILRLDPSLLGNPA